MTERWATVQYYEDGEWRNWMSLPWFLERPAEALALVREDDSDEHMPPYRLLITTEEVWDEKSIPDAQ